jgi:leader peptidase (prepilin peptidase) / N-methyltransferase
VAMDDLIGGVGIAALLLVIVLLFEKLRGIEAMGGGDIKLIFMTGIFLGWKANLLCLFIACIIGIVTGLAVKSGDKTFPWGPSIALAAVFCMLFGNELIDLYLGLF